MSMVQTVRTTDKEHVRRFERVLAELTQEIFAGRWRPGDRLPPESELGPELGTGRSSIREAVKALEHAGILCIQPGRGGGTYVVEPGHRQLGKALTTLFQMGGFDATALFEARSIIEPSIAACAAERSLREDIIEFDLILDEIAGKLKAGVDVSALNLRLHFAVARSTHNSLILVLAAALLDMMSQLDAQGIVVQHRRSQAFEQHQALVAAIAAHDAREAREVMARHIGAMALEIAPAQSRKQAR